MIILQGTEAIPLIDFVKRVEEGFRGTNASSLGLLQQDGTLEVFETTSEENARLPDRFIGEEKILLFGSLKQCRFDSFLRLLRASLPSPWSPNYQIRIEEAPHSSWLVITKK